MLSRLIMGMAVVLIAVNCWSAALQDNGNGTISDFDTGLTWQQTDDNVTRTWIAAGNYCAGLPLAGGGWRLPDVKELASIVDYRVDNPAIDDAHFPGTNVLSYWSASSVANNSGLAWRVARDDGNIYTNIKTFSYYVRCVR